MPRPIRSYVISREGNSFVVRVAYGRPQAVLRMPAPVAGRFPATDTQRLVAYLLGEWAMWGNAVMRPVLLATGIKERPMRPPRYPVRHIPATLLSEVRVQLVNVSETGALVEHVIPLHTGGHYRIHVEGTPLVLPCTVVRSYIVRMGIDATAPAVYQSGLTWHDPHPAMLRELRELQEAAGE